MWLYWTPGGVDHFRGYYPDMSLLPVPLAQLLQKFEYYVEYFNKTAIPGVMVAENLSIYEEFRSTFHQKTWTILDEHNQRVTDKCHIPPGKDQVRDGMYSLMIEKENHNNCISWVLDVVDKVMNENEYLKCPRTNRMKTVMKALGFIKDQNGGK